MMMKELTIDYIIKIRKNNDPSLSLSFSVRRQNRECNWIGESELLPEIVELFSSVIFSWFHFSNVQPLIALYAPLKLIESAYNF